MPAPTYPSSQHVRLREEKGGDTSPSSGALSKTVTEWPRLLNAIAVAKPPSPAPAMMTLSFTFACNGTSLCGSGPCSLLRNARLEDGYEVS